MVTFDDAFAASLPRQAHLTLLALLLGFCPHFFMIVSRDTYEILNVYKYEQMRRWIFQTFLTVGTLQ
jgi:hypothetical protein